MSDMMNKGNFDTRTEDHTIESVFNSTSTEPMPTIAGSRLSDYSTAGMDQNGFSSESSGADKNKKDFSERLDSEKSKPQSLTQTQKHNLEAIKDQSNFLAGDRPSYSKPAENKSSPQADFPSTTEKTEDPSPSLERWDKTENLAGDKPDISKPSEKNFPSENDSSSRPEFPSDKAFPSGRDFPSPEEFLSGKDSSPQQQFFSESPKPDFDKSGDFLISEQVDKSKFPSATDKSTFPTAIDKSHLPAGSDEMKFQSWSGDFKEEQTKDKSPLPDNRKPFPPSAGNDSSNFKDDIASADPRNFASSATRKPFSGHNEGQIDQQTDDKSTLETVKEKIVSGAEAVKDTATNIAAKIRDATYGKSEAESKSV